MAMAEEASLMTYPGRLVTAACAWRTGDQQSSPWLYDNTVKANLLRYLRDL